jgi:hypothetical protein
VTIEEFKIMCRKKGDPLSTYTKKVKCITKDNKVIDCALYEPITLARMIEINILGSEDDKELYAHTYEYGCMLVVDYYKYSRRSRR